MCQHRESKVMLPEHVAARDRRECSIGCKLIWSVELQRLFHWRLLQTPRNYNIYPWNTAGLLMGWGPSECCGAAFATLDDAVKIYNCTVSHSQMKVLFHNTHTGWKGPYSMLGFKLIFLIPTKNKHKKTTQEPKRYFWEGDKHNR